MEDVFDERGVYLCAPVTRSIVRVTSYTVTWVDADGG